MTLLFVVFGAAAFTWAVGAGRRYEFARRHRLRAQHTAAAVYAFASLMCAAFTLAALMTSR